MMAASIVLAAAAAAAPSPEASPFYRWFMRGLAGYGTAPHLPAHDDSGSLTETCEAGGHPLGAVFATGFSVSLAGDLGGHWVVFTPGLFAEFDLTALFLSGLWTYRFDPSDAPFQLTFGGRLGLGMSRSERPSGDVFDDPPYTLFRPEVQPYLDLAIPFAMDRSAAFVTRGAMDTAVNLSNVFRYSVTFGVQAAWGALK
jgi:hypothetical protein